MKNKELTKHLYVHAPLCVAFCTFCDFKRDLLAKHKSGDVIEILINQLKKYKAKQFDTIYIGGGTPNAFPDEELHKLLFYLHKLLANNGEFTIECNPDLVTVKQAKIIRDSGVNRISLGVQTTNEKILKLLNRTHSVQDCVDAIKIFRDFGITNISADFMYALPLMRTSDIENAAKFVYEQKLQHTSFYGLDLKPGSQLTKQKYKINLDDEADQLDTAIKVLKKFGYWRYEVSNWALKPEFTSKHNMAYWLTRDWAAVGYGAHGLENRIAYFYDGTIEEPVLTKNKLSEDDYYRQVLLMGLRLVRGIDISIEPYKTAYTKFKDKLKFVHLKDNHLICNNINLLNETLIEII